MSVTLQATKRTTGAKSTLTSLRRQGKLPAVLYGYNIESMPIVLDYLETAKAVQNFGRTSVFQIDVEGKRVNAVLNEIQRCARKGTVKHVDFLSINMSEELEVEVPVVLTGDSIGVKTGGVITQPTRLITIKVKPSDMPEQIEIDVSSLDIGDTLSVRDLRDKIQFEVINPDEDTLVTVTPPVTVSDDTAGQGDTENQDIKATEAPESES
nr:50S ribosomal protein L25/general stress protein Ctc [Lysinibacillus timonensis]